MLKLLPYALLLPFLSNSAFACAGAGKIDLHLEDVKIGTVSTYSGTIRLNEGFSLNGFDLAPPYYRICSDRYASDEVPTCASLSEQDQEWTIPEQYREAGTDFSNVILRIQENGQEKLVYFNITGANLLKGQRKLRGGCGDDAYGNRAK